MKYVPNLFSDGEHSHDVRVLGQVESDLNKCKKTQLNENETLLFQLVGSANSKVHGLTKAKCFTKQQNNFLKKNLVHLILWNLQSEKCSDGKHISSCKHK